MDENSCIKNSNDIIPTVVKNVKTAGFVAEAGGRSTEEYKKCQVHNIVFSNQYISPPKVAHKSSK